MPAPSRLAAAAAAALLACGGATPPATPGREALRVVTWNVHDLFDSVDRRTPPGDEDTVLAPAEVEAKLDRVGRVLASLDADVIVLQEVETEALLERLASRLGGPPYRAWLRDGLDPRGIDIGVLSRVDFSCRSHLGDRAAGGGSLWSRDLVEVRLAAGARPIVLLANHLVSRLDPADDARRMEQATRVRQVVGELQREAGLPAVLVVGDLNDVPGSPALRPLLGDPDLVDLGAELPVGQGWTWSGGGAQERIDYALLTPRDVALVTAVAVHGGAEVAAASDHRPLVVDLWLGAP